PREADAALVFARQPSFEDVGDVALVVREGQVRGRRRLRLTKIRNGHDPIRDHALAQPPVLRHRKRMRLGEGQEEVITIKTAQGDRNPRMTAYNRRGIPSTA